jgi:hypothetical protein
MRPIGDAPRIPIKKPEPKPHKAAPKKKEHAAALDHVLSKVALTFE